MRLKILFALICAVLVGTLFVGCDFTLAGSWKYTEMKRLRSPDSLVDAVVILGDSGATSPGTLFVYLVPAGQAVPHPDRIKPVFEARRLKGFEVDWRAPDLLEIH